MTNIEDAAEALRAGAPTCTVAEAKAALSRIAAGNNQAGDIRAVRVAVEQLDALATPPADDVRELVDRMRRASRAVYLATDATVADDISDMLTRAADALAEVRPRGTVTDAERFAKALHAIADGDGPYFVREFARDALEAAREACS